MEDAHNQNFSNLVNGELIRLPSFDWDKVKNVYYVAKLGSFSEAGKFLNISQSSLSRKISILESHLKFKLFTRVPKGVKLTRKGEELFLLVEQVFYSFKAYAHNVSITNATSIHNGKKRKIRIATTQAIASYILSDLLFNYNKENQHIVFDLIADDHMLDIFLNDVDIAIRPIDLRISDVPDEPSIQQEYLFSLEKQLYASLEYLEKYGEPLAVEDLKNHNVIGFDHPEKHPFSDINWILKLGMPKGKLRDPVFTTNSVECMIGAAKKGLGIVGSYDTYSIIKNSDLKIVLPDIRCEEVKEYFVYPDYLKDDKEIVALKNYLKNKLNPQM